MIVWLPSSPKTEFQFLNEDVARWLCKIQRYGGCPSSNFCNTRAQVQFYVEWFTVLNDEKTAYMHQRDLFGWKSSIFLTADIITNIWKDMTYSRLHVARRIFESILSRRAH